MTPFNRFSLRCIQGPVKYRRHWIIGCIKDEAYFGKQIWAYLMSYHANSRTGLDYEAIPRFSEFFSCCCLPLLPQLDCSILTTWEQPYSPALYDILCPPQCNIHSTFYGSSILPLSRPSPSPHPPLYDAPSVYFKTRGGSPLKGYGGGKGRGKQSKDQYSNGKG